MVGDVAYGLNHLGRILVVGIGKAAAAMARAVEAVLGDRITDGLIITKVGHAMPLKHCRVMEAAHPVPDENGVRATRALLEIVAAAAPDDLLICLISGGGSALSPAPVAGISLADKQATTRRLLACGATIHEINTVRKHLSRIKGGQLCRHANGASVAALILSDVIGDDLDIIASGITRRIREPLPTAWRFSSSIGCKTAFPDRSRPTWRLAARARSRRRPNRVTHASPGCKTTLSAISRQRFWRPRPRPGGKASIRWC
ncbi:glycerate-2-kinase family protein [Desulfosarcina cetonica]|uniref:glycerate-2-kinase family protein n=1 Tax=Desulfosarcina cetonica TaxID=90730 RepID=UPI0006D27CAF|nr:glycerate-2-kinase family protein [Desulfosarcina cetonica]